MARKPITETLREVHSDLWVSDQDSAQLMGDDFRCVLDCTGRNYHFPNTVNVVPTGTTNHTWTEDDLDRIVRIAVGMLQHGPVLIHCRRGVSRSACAAAAVILALGEADGIVSALEKTRFEDQKISVHSKAGLRRWWAARQNDLQELLPFGAAQEVA